MSSECIAQQARYQLDHQSQTVSWPVGTGEEALTWYLTRQLTYFVWKYISIKIVVQLLFSCIREQIGRIVSFKISNGHVFPQQNSKIAVFQMSYSRRIEVLCRVCWVCMAAARLLIPDFPTGQFPLNFLHLPSQLMYCFVLFCCFLSFSLWFKEVILAKCKIQQVIVPIILFLGSTIIWA